MFDRNLLLNRENNHWKIQSILLQCYFFVVQTLRVLTTQFHGKNIYFLFNIFKPLWEIVFIFCQSFKKKKKSCGQSISLCMYSSFCLTGVKWVRLKGEVEGVKFSGNGIAHTRSLLLSVWILGFCKLLTHTAVASTLFGRIELLSEALIVIMIQLRLVSQCISCPVSRAAMFGH